jgi:hypothetical protein
VAQVHGMTKAAATGDALTGRVAIGHRQRDTSHALLMTASMGVQAV